MNNALVADAAAGRFVHWGRSTTVDEHTGEPVLDAALVRGLHRAAGLVTDGVVGNAGLIHVYGYLLATAATPYGPKHARWTEGGVARALGLDPAALLPGAAGEPTPLATLTPILERLLSTPPSEAMVVDEAGNRVAARTVLLAAPSGGLLVYGVGVAGPMLPVTVFPIADPASTLAEIEAEPPRLRYNAVDATGTARLPLASRSVRRG